MHKKTVAQNEVAEFSFSSKKGYDDPFNEVTVDAVFGDTQGTTWSVPAFWTGKSEWRVRFSSHEVGEYTFSSVCSDTGNTDLHGIEGGLDVVPYEGDNALLKHGPLIASDNRRFLRHRDGTPFLWLGDTWWLALSGRCGWPDEFRMLTKDRVEKGFSVVQLVAGLFPDIAPLDPRGANEGGLPWEAGFARVNPAFFDHADRKIAHLVDSAVVPCIVCTWGYYLLFMGEERMRQHMRYLVARYGAYPVLWCAAGETTMPFYHSSQWERDIELLRERWTGVVRYLRETDPFHRLIAAHSRTAVNPREEITDEGLLDFGLSQANQDGYEGLPLAVEHIVDAVGRSPVKPVVMGEVSYEGTHGSCWQDIQRFLYWSTMLSGACGYTYGAEGMWEFMNQEDLRGVYNEESPWGNDPAENEEQFSKFRQLISWTSTPWKESWQYPGGNQVGQCKRFLQRFEWWRFEPHQEWIEPSAGSGNWIGNYAAGIPGEIHIIYFGTPVYPWVKPRPLVKGLVPSKTYRVTLFDPKSGVEVDAGEITSDEEGTWRVRLLPTLQDWVAVLEKVWRRYNDAACQRCVLTRTGLTSSSDTATERSGSRPLRFGRLLDARW